VKRATTAGCPPTWRSIAYPASTILPSSSTAIASAVTSTVEGSATSATPNAASRTPSSVNRTAAIDFSPDCTFCAVAPTTMPPPPMAMASGTSFSSPGRSAPTQPSPPPNVVSSAPAAVSRSTTIPPSSPAPLAASRMRFWASTVTAWTMSTSSTPGCRTGSAMPSPPPNAGSRFPAAVYRTTNPCGIGLYGPPPRFGAV
jgi:S-DNA-T family DNA segregation ATPase FtsK/SpoIIIE